MITEQFGAANHPNVHLAIEAYLSENNRTARLIGINTGHNLAWVKLSQLATSTKSSPKECPVEFTNITLSYDSVIPCVNNGLYLISDGTDRLAILIRATRETFRSTVELEVMAKERQVAERFLANLKILIRKRNVYRGQVISLASRDNLLRDNTSNVKFHRLAKITRDDLILPVGVLERIERQTIFFSKNREKLLKAGRHSSAASYYMGLQAQGKLYLPCILLGRWRIAP